MEEGNGNGAPAQQTVEVPQSLIDLSSALEGLAGSGQILQETGAQAVKEGIIKNVNPDAAVVDKPQVVIPKTDAESAVAQNAKPKTGTGDDPNLEIPAPNPEDDADENNQDNQQSQNDDDDDDDDVKSDNPLINIVKGKKKKDISFDSFDQIRSHAEKEFGIKTKDEKDFGKFFSASKKWREDASKLPDLEGKVEQFEKIFTDMPTPLLNATKAFFEGRSDWDKEIVARPKFDFNKPAEQQDKKAMVNFYYPGKFTDEDFSEETPSPALEMAIQTSQDKFNISKRELENESATQTREARTRLDIRNTSIASSLKTLKQSFPELDKSSHKKIENILDSGDLSSMFMNKDGGFKPEAAEMIMMALFGKETITHLMSVSAKRAESKANEDILSRGADKPKPQQKGGNRPKPVDEKTTKAIESLIGGLNKNKTY